MLYLCTRKWGDQVAQSVEHIPFKDGVPGSSPGLVTKRAAFKYLKPLFFVALWIFRNFASIHAAAVDLHAGMLKCKGYGAFHHYIAFSPRFTFGVVLRDCPFAVNIRL